MCFAEVAVTQRGDCKQKRGKRLEQSSFVCRYLEFVDSLLLVNMCSAEP